MKRILLILLALLCLTVLLAACTTPASTTTESETTPEDTPAVTTPADTTPKSIPLAEEGKPLFTIVGEKALLEEHKELLDGYTKRIADEGITAPKVFEDTVSRSGLEIVLGKTTRGLTLKEDMEFYQYYVSYQKGKILVQAKNAYGYEQGLTWLYDTYIKGKGDAMAIPDNLDFVGALDFTYSEKHDMTYEAIRDDVWNSFNEEYWSGMWVKGNAFWDTAEMVEVYVDAYEQSRDPEMKKKMLNYAKVFYMSYQKDWTWNDYNDDIMWITIAYCRVTLLTGDNFYYDLAKPNFDAVWERGYNDELGGGLYWKMNEATMSKNSCVNCPGAIAACLIGQISGDESYFEKAKSLMEWELEHMFEKDTGRVYDALNVKGNLNKWASTYNQGTFVGACTMLYQHYKDEAWLEYAQKAVEYAMANLDDGNSGVISGEANGNDLPGFKGILTRWFYRYAIETENIEVLLFLQHNADAAYANRNEKGLIWTKWNEKTPDDLSGYITFGQSTAVALVFNSQPWWDTVKTQE